MPRFAAPILVALVLALASPWAGARTLGVWIGTDLGPAGASPGGRVTLHDLRVGDDAFDLALGWTDRRADAAAVWRRTIAAGPLGTLVVDARLGTEAAAPGAAAGVRGTVGPIALRAEVEVGTRRPGPFRVVARAPSAAAPAGDAALLTGAAGGWRGDASATLTWRPDRFWTLEAAPRVHRGGGGWAAGIALDVRRAGVAAELDLSGRLDVAGGSAAGHALLGVTAHHVPRRAPESRATLWWGVGPDGWAPGAEFAWVERASAGQLTLAAGRMPAWSDRPAAYAALTVQAPLQGGTLWLGGRWDAVHQTRLELGWSRPWEP